MFVGLMVLALKAVLGVLVTLAMFAGAKCCRYVYRALVQPSYHRQLTQAELEWVDSIALRLEADKVGQNYPRWIRLLGQGLIAFLISTAFMVGATVLAVSYWQPEVPPRALVWERVVFGVSALLGGLFAVMLFSLLGIALAKRSSLFRDYQVFQCGWGTMSPQERAYDDLVADLTHLLRAKKVHRLQDYNPDSLSDLIFHRTTPVLRSFAVLVGTVYVVFLVSDIRSFTTLLPDRIEHSPYFSLSTLLYGYEDIQAFDYKCTATREDGALAARLNIAIVMRDDLKISIYDEDHRDKARQMRALVYITEQAASNAQSTFRTHKALVITREISREECLLLLQDIDPTGAGFLRNRLEAARNKG